MDLTDLATIKLTLLSIQENLFTALKNHYMILSEADVLKRYNNTPTLDYLKDKHGKLLLMERDGVIIVTQTHTKDKGSKRFLDPKTRFLITDKDSYRSHIADIFNGVCDKFKVDEINNPVKENLVDVMSRMTKKKYQDISKIRDYNDDIDDVSFKLSLYQLISYMNRTYMIEAAIAIVGTYFSYGYVPIAYIKTKEPDVWNKLIKINTMYDNFLDLNAIDFTTPILNITGYSTWLKEITDLNNVYPLPNIQLGHNEYTEDIYMKQIDQYGAVFSYPYKTNEIIKITDSSIFNALKQFEKNRP